MSDPAGQNGNSVEGDDEHASEGPGVQQDEVLHWKQQAEQARLEAFQLRCVIDAKDKEIQLLRQQLVDQVCIWLCVDVMFYTGKECMQHQQHRCLQKLVTGSS
jgi:hypothetical protein